MFGLKTIIKPSIFNAQPESLSSLTKRLEEEYRDSQRLAAMMAGVKGGRYECGC